MTDRTALGRLKQAVVGRPIPSELAHRERFSKATGLAVLSSDALSSVAYATEEILRTLVVLGVGALWLATPVGAVIAGLLLVIAFSYRQTIQAYPAGGGAYRVAKENIGVPAGLVAAAALLLDYVLTVAVSIAAGVAAVTSAFPGWHVNRVELALGFVALVMVANLRGVRESGRIFAVPTYFFIASVLLLLAVGVWRVLQGDAPAVSPAHAPHTALSALPVFLVLRAFANGCTALTGVEALADGVPAFRPPEARNAATTLLVMAGLAVTMFLGITLLADAWSVAPSETETVVSQLARAVFEGRGLPYYLVQAATMLILVLAANTAYSDFPRLASIMAHDRFLPRQFMNRGDRLAFSNGILVLSVLAALLIVVFRGDTHALIPLYMIGVFISFTLSQSGMVIKWRRERGPGWRRSAAVNAVGATLTGIVLVVVAVTKFREGAWIVLAVLPMVVLLFHWTRQHYLHVASQLSLEGWQPRSLRTHIVLVPIGGVNRAVVRALEYARAVGHDVRAITVDVDPRITTGVREGWSRWGQGVKLEVLESPYRSLVGPLLEYIEEVRRTHPGSFISIVLPEFVPARWWHHLLHNQQALLIKGALLFKPDVIVTNVPFHLRR